MSWTGATTRLVVGVVIIALAVGCGGVAPTGTPSPSGPSAAGGSSATSTPATPGAASPGPPAVATGAPTRTPAAATPTPSPQPSSSGVWPLPVDAAIAAATAKALQVELGELVANSPAKGAAAAVLTATGRWAGAAGVDAGGVPVKPSSAFGIGSITKTATAAEVLLLASLGKLDLDAPVTQYVSLPFDARGATIRQLATMKSGFPAGPDEELNQAIAKDLGKTWTAADMVASAKDGARLGTLGGAGVYNGINYQVLSMVIEKVTGQRLATVLRHDLLGPAGLDRMWVQVGEKPTAPLTVAADPGAKIVDPTSGYLPSRAAASTGNGAAGMAADAPTLARWGYLLFGGRIVDPALVAIMTNGDPFSEYGYGFGVMIGDDNSKPVVGHGGDYIGYSAFLGCWPDTRTVVVVLLPAQGMSMEATSWSIMLHKTLTAGG
jgi:D-alanyl-D-alanine carboxypeptidase